MRRRSLLLAATLLVVAILPATLLAQPSDRDVLITSDGTVYTIETEDGANYPNGVAAEQVLALTIQQGGTKVKKLVPDSINLTGIHKQPALAYDPESKTLFLLWVRYPGGTSTELLLSSYQNGTWQHTSLIDDQPSGWDYRRNLRIAVTRRVSQQQSDGTFIDAPGLVLHAVWLSESSERGVRARYAAIALQKGSVASSEARDLIDLLPSSSQVDDTPAAQSDSELLHHPAFVDSPSPNSVDVIFGDVKTGVLNRLTLRPQIGARIHVPIGFIGMKPGTPRFRTTAPDSSVTANWSGRIAVITSGRDDDKLLFYNIGKEDINYLIYGAGNWSTVQSVRLSDQLSAEAVVSALSRMVRVE